jgi:hypothetical protein
MKAYDLFKNLYVHILKNNASNICVLAGDLCDK